MRIVRRSATRSSASRKAGASALNVLEHALDAALVHPEHLQLPREGDGFGVSIGPKQP